MADKVELVRGTIGGVSVQTSKENAERLGAQFESGGGASAKDGAAPAKDEEAASEEAPPAKKSTKRS